MTNLCPSEKRYPIYTKDGEEYSVITGYRIVSGVETEIYSKIEPFIDRKGKKTKKWLVTHNLGLGCSDGCRVFMSLKGALSYFGVTESDFEE